MLPICNTNLAIWQCICYLIICLCKRSYKNVACNWNDAGTIVLVDGHDLSAPLGLNLPPTRPGQSPVANDPSVAVLTAPGRPQAMAAGRHAIGHSEGASLAARKDIQGYTIIKYNKQECSGVYRDIQGYTDILKPTNIPIHSMSFL